MSTLIAGLTKNCMKNEYFQLFTELIIIFYPLFITMSLHFLVNLTPIVVAGQLGRIQLDGVALALSMIHIFGTSIGYGLSIACDTLFSQAFGSSDKKKTGFYLQKSIYISILFVFPIVGILLNIDSLLLLIGQDPQICEICSNFIILYLPALPMQYMFYILSRYMQNQDKLWPGLASALVGNIFNITTQYLFVFQWNYTYRASAVCMITTYLLMVLINLFYLLISGFYKPTWPGWTMTALYDWSDFLKLAFPAIGYATIEQVNWEAEIFMAGYMGIVPMAVHSVLSQTGTVTAGGYYAVGVSANVKIGQYIGANQPTKAKKVAKMAIVNSIVLAIVVGAIIASISGTWAKLFTSDQLVSSQASQLLTFYLIYYIPESVNNSLAGIIRGCSKHLLAMILAIISMYLIGLPTAACLGFLAKLKVTGLWIGNCTGLATLMILYSMAIWRLNWEKITDEAIKRLEATNYNQDFETVENQPLMNSSNSIKKIMHPVGHLRMPSQGFTCSSDLTQVKNSILKENKILRSRFHPNRKSIFLKRIITLFFCIIILFIGIAMRFVFRPNYEIYMPTPSKPAVNVSRNVSF